MGDLTLGLTPGLNIVCSCWPKTHFNLAWDSSGQTVKVIGRMCPPPNPFLIKKPCLRNGLQKSLRGLLPWTPDLTFPQIQMTLTFSTFQAYTASAIPVLVLHTTFSPRRIRDPHPNLKVQLQHSHPIQSFKPKLQSSNPFGLQDSTTKSTMKKEPRGTIKGQEAALQALGFPHQLLINSAQSTLRPIKANQGLFDIRVSQHLLS